MNEGIDPVRSILERAKRMPTSGDPNLMIRASTSVRGDQVVPYTSLVYMRSFSDSWFDRRDSNGLGRSQTVSRCSIDSAGIGDELRASGLSRPSAESRNREVDSVIVIKEQLIISYMTPARDLRSDRFLTNRDTPDRSKRHRQRCCLLTRRIRGVEWADDSVIMSS